MFFKPNTPLLKQPPPTYNSNHIHKVVFVMESSLVFSKLLWQDSLSSKVFSDKNKYIQVFFYSFSVDGTLSLRFIKIVEKVKGL